MNINNIFKGRKGVVKNYRGGDKILREMGNSVVSGVSKMRSEKGINSIFRFIIILFTVLILVLSIFLLRYSSDSFSDDGIIGCNKKTTKYRNNTPGMIIGLLTLLFSFIILLFLVFGNNFIVKFSSFFYWGIGGLFFLSFLSIVIGFLYKNNITENFSSPFMAQGPCEKDGLYGYLIDGECIVGGKKRRRKRRRKGKGKGNENGKGIGSESEEIYSESDEICEEELSKCNENKEECNKKVEKAVENERDKLLNGENEKRGENGSKVAKFGICQYEDFDNKIKFGYLHPAFGKKCLSSKKMQNFFKCHPEYGKVKPISINNVKYNPYQSTDCLAFPKDDLLSYDLKCKKKYGKNYGVKLIEGFGCPPNDNRGLCEIDYQMGVEIPSNSTKCVPIGTEMNGVCQLKHMREKKNKFTRVGYKSIEFSGCPKGYQRAICDGNYYDGKELFKNATECFEQSFEPNRMCKEKFGKVAFVDRIISENCNPGFIRAVCKNIKQ